ncbi:hypothetical protein D3C71_1219430 [compost metagenome]
MNRESNVYGVVNVKHEFLDGTRVRVADVAVASRMARTWGSVGAGANYGWGDRSAIYGQIDADADFSGSYIVTATYSPPEPSSVSPNIEHSDDGYYR